MHPKPNLLPAAFAANLAKLGISRASHLTVAVSGGLDSMVLLHLLFSLEPPAKPKLTVAHLNHRLRDSESEADQQLVASVCSELRLPFVTKTLKKGVIQNAHQQTVEEAARSLRYQWLEEIASGDGATVIATGHHSDDQAETVLHHLTRGTGLRGMQGMLPERRLKEGTRLLRPLLPFSRQQIQNHANQLQISFREDSTNADVAFTRNKIRQQLASLEIAGGEAVFPEQLIQLASSAEDAVRSLDKISEQLASASVVTRTKDHVLLRAESLAKMPCLIRSHFFTWLWIQQDWPRQKMTVAHWKRLSEATKTPAPLRFQLPGRAEITRIGHWIRLFRPS